MRVRFGSFLPSTYLNFDLVVDTCEDQVDCKECKGELTFDEKDEELLVLCDLTGCDFEEVARSLGSFSAEDCANRYSNVMKRVSNAAPSMCSIR